MTDQELSERLLALRTKIWTDIDAFVRETDEYPNVRIEQIETASLVNEKPVVLYTVFSHINRRID